MFDGREMTSAFIFVVAEGHMLNSLRAFIIYNMYKVRQENEWISKAYVLYIVKFTVGLLSFSIHNLYAMPFTAKISLLSNSVVMTTPINMDNWSAEHRRRGR